MEENTKLNELMIASAAVMEALISLRAACWPGLAFEAAHLNEEIASAISIETNKRPETESDKT